MKKTVMAAIVGAVSAYIQQEEAIRGLSASIYASPSNEPRAAFGTPRFNESLGTDWPTKKSQ